MRLIHSPMTSGGEDVAPGAGMTVRAMEIGQHIIAVALTAILVPRAISEGTAIPAAIIAGVAILAWHVAGTILPSRMSSRLLAVWWLVGFALVWIAAVAVSAEFIWLAFLLWLLAGHLLPLGWGLVYAALVFVVVVAAPILHYGATTYANVFGPLIGGIFAFGISRGYLQLLKDAAERERLVITLTRAQEEMSQLQDELALAQRHSGAIAERTRISRDLHDTVAQSLSSIRLISHAQISAAPLSDSVRTLSQIEALAVDSIGDVRRIVASLIPAELEDAALPAALQRMLKRTEDETGLLTEFSFSDGLPVLSTESEVALLRVAQSAIANVRLHAHATHISLSLSHDAETLRIEIRDNGAGFDASNLQLPADASTSSFGLRFMKSRLLEFSGDLEVTSTSGNGTTVSAYLPLKARGDGQS